MASIFPYLRHRYGSPVPPLSRIRSELARDERFRAPLPAERFAPMTGPAVGVVGAGFAGLTAAVHLREVGCDVTVFEARPDVGGRVWSRTDICKGRVIEAGAELIGANHPAWLQSAIHFGLGLSVLTSEEQFTAASLGMPLMLQGEVLAEAEAEKLYKEMDTTLRLISRDAATIRNPYQPWLTPGADDWDNTSVEDRLIQLNVEPGSQLLSLLSANLSNDQTLPISEQSYLGLLALVRGGRIGDDDMAYWTETEVYRCAAGNQALAYALRKLLEDTDGKVLVDTRVTDIDLSGEAGVSVTTDDGATHQFAYAVLAIPQPAWRSIQISPTPDPATHHITTGPAVKYLSPVKDRFWLLSELAPTSISDTLGMTWEGTDNQMVVTGQGLDLSVFAGGPCARAARNAASKKEYFTKALSSMYEGYADHTDGDGYFIDWPGEPTIGCGYSCPSLGQVTTVAPNLIKLYRNRLAFAGEHTIMAMFGYMEGALQSGIAAASLIGEAAGID